MQDFNNTPYIPKCRLFSLYVFKLDQVHIKTTFLYKLKLKEVLLKGTAKMTSILNRGRSTKAMLTSDEIKITYTVIFI